MKHIFRLNVYKRGYTLYAGYPKSQYQEFPLDVLSHGISQNYLSAQGRIDNLLETRIPRWHFTIVNTNLREPPIVAYGCLLPLEDDKGRHGISFLHAVESDENVGIHQIVACISQFLAFQNVDEVNKLLSGLAKGSIRSQQVIEKINGYYTRLPVQSQNSSMSRGKPIKKIIHDCGGASAVAWLAMATSHLSAYAPWEIYETYSPSSNTISTISSCKSAIKTYSLSDYLFQLIRDHELLEELYTSRQKNDDEFNKPRPFHMDDVTAESNAHRLPLPTEIQSTQMHQQDIEELGYKGSFKQNAPVYYENNYPSDGHLVEFDSFHGFKIVLVSHDEIFSLDLHNCFSVTEKTSYYEFGIVKTRIFRLIRKQIKLILPKNALTEEQVRNVNRFSRLIGSRS